MTATTFSGALSGNASSATNANNATNATNINISATTSSDTSTSIVLVANQSIGNQSPFINSGLSYNADTNTMTATTFSGALSGNASSATQLQTSRTFTITGVVDAPAVSFNGTGNVELVTTLDDNSVTTAKIDFQNALVPVGGIIMWSGITIPTGWALCNGSNGTPDLRNKFIVAADSLTKTGITTQSGISPYDPGDVGGSTDATLVSHSHTGTTEGHSADHIHAISDPGHAHSYITSRLGAARNDTAQDDYIYQEAATTGPSVTGITETQGTSNNHAHNFTTSIQGSPATNANLPPYYALAFIMRTS
jgi:hypothetical protein